VIVNEFRHEFRTAGGNYPRCLARFGSERLFSEHSRLAGHFDGLRLETLSFRKPTRSGLPQLYAG
jgi:hypothetical protein